MEKDPSDSASQPWPIYYVIIPNLVVGILLTIAFHFIRKKGARYLRLEQNRMEADRRMREEFRNNQNRGSINSAPGNREQQLHQD